MKEVTYTKERVSNIKKVSRQVIQDIEITTGQDGEDFIRDEMTAELSGFIYSLMHDEKKLTYVVKRPTFLDWLLRREKFVRFTVKVSDVLIYPPQPKDTVRLYAVEQDGEERKAGRLF